MTDTVTPHFYKLQRQGYIINNPYDKVTSVETITANPLYQYQVLKSGMSYDGFWYNGPATLSSFVSSSQYLPPPSSVNVSTLIDEAVTDAWAKVDVSEIASLATLAEGRETIDSLVSIFRRLVKVTRAVRKLNLQALAKEIKPRELSKRYLEARYAIRPMYYDAKGVLAAYNAKNKPNDRQTFRGRASQTDSTVAGSQKLWGSSQSELWCHRSTSYAVEARAGVLAKIEDISRASIWGLDQPIEAVWEIIPFSFIIDWFFNVGKVISSWTPNTGLRELASWCVVNETTFQSIIVDEFRPIWPTSDIFAKEASYSGERSKTIVHKYRLVKPTRAVLPHFKLRLDAAKLLDLALIARQCLR